MDEAPEATGGRSKLIKKILLGSAATVLVAALAGGAYWTLTCPCEGTPGFVLLGDVQEEPVADWGFANDVQLCQIQISIAWRPHAVNLNCMATPQGDLFLSCSVGARKYWCPRVQTDHEGRFAFRDLPQGYYRLGEELPLLEGGMGIGRGIGVLLRGAPDAEVVLRPEGSASIQASLVNWHP